MDAFIISVCSIPPLKQNMDSAFGASLDNVNCSLEKVRNETDLKIKQLVAAPGLNLKWSLLHQDWAMTGRSLGKSWLHFQRFFFTTELTRTAMVLLCFYRLTSALSIGRHQIQVTSCMIENVSTSLSELCYISNCSWLVIRLQGQQLVLSMHLTPCRLLAGECWVQDFR